MDKKILIQIRSSYGRDNIYVVSEHAEAIQSLTNKKTIDACDIRQLEVLGFVVEQVPLLVPIS